MDTKPVALIVLKKEKERDFWRWLQLLKRQKKKVFS